MQSQSGIKHDYDEGKTGSISALLGKAISDSKNSLFGEVNELQKYKKYEHITAEKKKALLDLIKIGINPENYQTKEEKEKASAQFEMISHYFDEMAEIALD